VGDQPLDRVGEVVRHVGGTWSAEVGGGPVEQRDPRGRRSVHREGAPSEAYRETAPRACWTTSATTPGWEIMITCDPSTSVVVAPARWAM
jgi:hypothetical protein